MLTPEQAGRLSIVLVATRNSLNIGAVARVMSNFGVLQLRVVRPYEPAFRTARSAVGAVSLLEQARQFDSVADAVSDSSLVIGTTAVSNRRELQQPMHRLDAAAPSIASHLQSQRAAILFGSEKFGLSNDDLSHCNWLMHIPTRSEHLSMNLGQAVAVCLYELVRDAEAVHGPPLIVPPFVQQTPAGDRERLSDLFLDLLRISGYLEKHQQADMPAHIRRIITRFNLNLKDAQALQGMLRQVLWKLGARKAAPSAPLPPEKVR